MIVPKTHEITELLHATIQLPKKYAFKKFSEIWKSTYTTIIVFRGAVELFKKLG